MAHKENLLSRRVEPLKTGELLVKEGLIRMDDIHLALSIQEKRQASRGLKKRRLIGMILCDLNLITPIDNYYVLHKYNKLLSISSALISKKMLTSEVVRKIKEDSRHSDIPFISFLFKKGLLSTTGLQALLFDLFHIPFRSVSDFSFNKKDLKELVQVMDARKAMENRILPLILKKNTILFGITDPDNILFIRDLNNFFPQYRFKALFIPFDGFSWFYNIIYENHPNQAVPEEKPLDFSLLLSFKTAVKHPEQEEEAIRILYERYEHLRQLSGNPVRVNLQNEFNEFIVKTHERLTREYKSRVIEFFLEKQGRDVKLMAFPVNTGNR